MCWVGPFRDVFKEKVKVQCLPFCDRPTCVTCTRVSFCSFNTGFIQNLIPYCYSVLIWPNCSSMQTKATVNVQCAIKFTDAVLIQKTSQVRIQPVCFLHCFQHVWWPISWIFKNCQMQTNKQNSELLLNCWNVPSLWAAVCWAGDRCVYTVWPGGMSF